MARLLVIDDEPEICRFVERALQSAGHQVTTAPDGLAGLTLATGQNFDLIILDLAMPDVDGVMVLAAALAHDPAQRVIVLSARGSVDARVECLERGAVDFVVKPFAVRELLARVDARLSEHRDASTPSTLRNGRLVLDLRRRSVCIDGHTSVLSQREFLLLQYLMRRAGLVCTREELLSEVWGYGFDPGSNVVDVYVRRLRSKVDRELIRTVRNVGYQLQSA
jgi:DNA-binding response OmpR family regulator